MQEEIKKHVKKIYNKANSKEHTLLEKIKDIIIEILIIVFAVSLSIWFHNWSEESNNEEDARGFLADLKVDLKNDSIALVNSIEDYQKNIQQLRSSDTERSFIFTSTLINDGNFQGFKQSGKIGFIANNELRLKLLHYYDQTNKGIQIHNAICNDLLMKIISKNQSEKINLENIYHSEATKNITHLKKDITTIQSIIKLIDETQIE